jgi:hypothetical protein
MNDKMKIKITLTDNDGTIYERELELIKKIQTNGNQEEFRSNQQWYKTGSTTEKLVKLMDEGFFNENRTIKDIIIKLKSQDYHFEPKDLTMPLRSIVRKKLLKKTKELPDGTKSGKWTYQDERL